MCTSETRCDVRVPRFVPDRGSVAVRLMIDCGGRGVGGGAEGAHAGANTPLRRTHHEARTPYLIATRPTEHMESPTGPRRSASRTVGPSTGADRSPLPHHIPAGSTQVAASRGSVAKT